MSCALHQIGFRAAEKILEASDSPAMDMQLRAHLAYTARDIQDRLFNFDPSNFFDPISPHEAADLQEHLQDLERALAEPPSEEEDLKQKIARFVEKIDNIIRHR
jgi:hypothetical protein